MHRRNKTGGSMLRDEKKFDFLKVDHHMTSGDSFKEDFKPDEHKKGQMLCKVCCYFVAAPLTCLLFGLRGSHDPVL